MRDAAARIDRVRVAVRGASRPRVAALEWLDPPFAAGHWTPQLIEYAGGEDVLGFAGENSEERSWEAIAAAQPDIVIVMPCGYDAEIAHREAEMHRDQLAAVGAGEVVAVDAAAYFSRPGPRLVDGLELLAQIIHPELVPEARRPGADGRALSARRVLFVHSSSGRYGADRQLLLIATGLDRSRYEPIVVLPEAGTLVDDLAAAGVEVLVRPVSVIRRGAVHPRGLVSIAAVAVREAGALGRLIRRRRVAIVHSNTSVVISGAGAAAVARVPHVWHVREIYSRLPGAWPLYRRALSSAAALPCVSRAARRPASPTRNASA